MGTIFLCVIFGGLIAFIAYHKAVTRVSGDDSSGAEDAQKTNASVIIIAIVVTGVLVLAVAKTDEKSEAVALEPITSPPALANVDETGTPPPPMPARYPYVIVPAHPSSAPSDRPISQRDKANGIVALCAAESGISSADHRITPSEMATMSRCVDRHR